MAAKQAGIAVPRSVPDLCQLAHQISEYFQGLYLLQSWVIVLALLNTYLVSTVINGWYFGIRRRILSSKVSSFDLCPWFFLGYPAVFIGVLDYEGGVNGSTVSFGGAPLGYFRRWSKLTIGIRPVGGCFPKSWVLDLVL